MVYFISHFYFGTCADLYEILKLYDYVCYQRHISYQDLVMRCSYWQWPACMHVHPFHILVLYVYMVSYFFAYSATSDSKVHGANMGPTWVLSVPDGPHVGPRNLAIRDAFILLCQESRNKDVQSIIWCQYHDWSLLMRVQWTTSQH